MHWKGVWLNSTNFLSPTLAHREKMKTETHTHTQVCTACLWNDTLFCSHLSFLYSVRGWGTKGPKLSWVIKPHISFFFQNVFSGTYSRESWQIRQGGCVHMLPVGFRRVGCLLVLGAAKNHACQCLTGQSRSAVMGRYDWWYYVLTQDLNASTLLWFNPCSFITHPGAADGRYDAKPPLSLRPTP